MSTDTAWSRFLFDTDGTAAANTSSKYVPRVLVTEICSYLRVKELASQLALTSRRGYSTVREYGDHIEAHWKRKVKADPLDQSTIDYYACRDDEIAVYDRSDDLYVNTCIPSVFLELVELRKSESIELLTRSRLRSLVVGLNLDENSLMSVNAIATEMPHLRALRVILQESDYEFLEFPNGLTWLDLHINASPCCSTGVTPAVVMVTSKLVRCCAKTLVRFAFGPHSTVYDYGSAKTKLEEPTDEVIKNIVKLTKLRHFDCGWHDLISTGVRDLTGSRR